MFEACQFLVSGYGCFRRSSWCNLRTSTWIKLMSNIQKWTEYVKRGIQLVVGLGIFEFPLLLTLRVRVYCFLFKGNSTGSMIHRDVMFYVPHGVRNAEIRFGEEIDINHGVEIDYSGGVVIGARVWLSQNVLIETHEHVIGAGNKKDWSLKTYPLEIGNDVWVGANAVILPKVRRIGRNAIIGAGSIVTKEVPENAVVAGNPAKILMMRAN